MNPNNILLDIEQCTKYNMALPHSIAVAALAKLRSAEYLYEQTQRLEVALHCGDQDSFKRVMMDVMQASDTYGSAGGQP